MFSLSQTCSFFLELTAFLTYESIFNWEDFVTFAYGKSTCLVNFLGKWPWGYEAFDLFFTWWQMLPLKNIISIHVDTVGDITCERLKGNVLYSLYAVTNVYSQEITTRSVNIAGVTRVISKRAGRDWTGTTSITLQTPSCLSPVKTHWCLHSHRVTSLNTCAMFYSKRHFGRSPAFRLCKQTF